MKHAKMIPILFVLFLGWALVPPLAFAQNTIYSGPQPGEPLPSFAALAVNGPHAGREFDFIEEYGDSPILLIFAHYIDRNVYRILWPCDRYAAERASAGLRTLYVFLAPDKLSGERRMAQVVKSLSLEVPVAVSLEGLEGPGAYGLNKEAGVTVLVAKNRKVVSNITLIQPGLVDSPKIMDEVAKLVGGHVPSPEELGRLGPRYRMTSPGGMGSMQGSTSEGGNAAAGATPPKAGPPDFESQLQPMLVKAGCFSGACHGAAAGKKGFKLSLLGYDPELDYESMVRQYRGRRINLVQPAKSLLLMKPSMQVAHEGGKRFSRNSKAYRSMLAWLRAGAPFRAGEPRKIVSLQVLPGAQLVKQAGTEGQLKVIASFSDHTQEDVTPYALYLSNDDAVASVTDTGGFTVNAVGETSLSARYMGMFATARVGMPFEGDVDRIDGLTGDASSFIDQRVNQNLRRLRIEPSPVCSDAEFLRRAYLDIVGTLPSVSEARAFLADEQPDRRVRLIDELLQRPEFGRYWSLWLLDLFRVKGRNIGEENTRVFARWIEQGLASDASLGDIMSQVLTAEGDGTVNAAANFLRQENDPKLLSEVTTEALMGSRSRCAQCHNHPFDSWTQTQYHRMASFFVRVNKSERGIVLTDHGEIEHPKTGKAVLPGFPDGTMARVQGPDRRVALADWLVSPQNRYFARSMSNRIWAKLMGRGIIEPVDNLSVSNAASNPALATALEDYFKGRLGGHPSPRYSIKALIREIVRSDAYQRSALPNGSNKLDDRFYSRALARPLDAYAYVDAIAQVTGVAETFEGLPSGTRAIDVADASVQSYLLDVCGRCRREDTCDGPNAAAGGIRQALHLINGPALNTKISAAGGRLQRLLTRNATAEDIAEEFYLAALSRPPSEEEKKFWLSQISESEGARTTFEDLIWALLNTRQFVFNR